jgi:hypothetical protein
LMITAAWVSFRSWVLCILSFTACSSLLHIHERAEAWRVIAVALLCCCCRPTAYNHFISVAPLLNPGRNFW